VRSDTDMEQSGFMTILQERKNNKALEGRKSGRDKINERIWTKNGKRDRLQRA